MSAAPVRLVFGTMQIGLRLTAAAGAAAIDVFVNAGHSELDTALMYADGQTEVLLGQMPLVHDKAKTKIATKANPWQPNDLTAAGVAKQLNASLASLKLSSVDLFYLHAPDHKTPLEETLEACNDLHKAGKFTELGLSNYSAELVRKVVEICKARGWIAPTVYQGMYNAITRQVEKDLLPVLREFNIRFYIYNPLAGGLLTGRYTYEDTVNQPAGRFFNDGAWAKTYRERYWKRENFDALEKVKAAIADSYPDGRMTLTAAALAWCLHHSVLSGDHGDAVILGASTVEQLRENLAGCATGPLDNAVVAAFDAAWANLEATCPSYSR
ncbi:AKR7A2 protein [Capsaspora owczarzaki ATCC 30864]|uniref:AKR7A2 protein n=1 Tax=Capsaspora owczarzaki (strain ATCC 30864) TaxID=595528 RepID=A0A0D2UJP8_CAPO3|nr:AKR7A2 protein [Capsaspora owczarzaki ATCC 30864]KJE95331.1 AKR7A2 protein [Capsaspora owczarzaki ATCC 30864]|eukprot:XP_004346461.1 AKR7A2 protein [Capsaspora owczarzaki ATCC 30864]